MRFTQDGQTKGVGFLVSLLSMALTLRSTDSVQRSDKISSLLDKIITPETDAAARQLKLAKDAQRSEYEAYMERETWTKMRTDREKDMVLLFGDDDVRIFKRNPQNMQKVAKLRSAARGGATLSKHDLVDVSGLVPIALDKSIVDTVTGSNGEYVPYSQDERQKIQQRKQEIALRRQMLANQYVFVSQNAAAAAQQQLAQLQQQQLTELGIQLPTDTTRGEEPAQIPLKAWQSWIPRRADHGKDGRDGTSNETRHQRRRRRHHRLNCKYHPFSTNAEMRRLAIQTTFPRRTLRDSLDRVQHAANGAPNGQGQKFVVESCFPAVEYVGPSASMLPPNIAGSPLAGSNGNSAGFGAGAARQLRKSSISPNLQHQHGGSFRDKPIAELQSTTQLPMLADGVQTDLNLAGSVSSGSRPSISPLFMTETTLERKSAMERVNIPSLAPFEKPPRPHSAEGEFLDCDCTPRLTDDEWGAGSETGSAGGSPSPEASKKRNVQLGSAARAEKRLELWHREFMVANVHARCALQSLLDERAEMRDFVLSEREHLNLVVHEAELSGADFHVSRRHRCTTPMKSSMWSPVYRFIGDDTRHVVDNVTQFCALLDRCEENSFPSEPWEKEMLEDVRKACIESALIRQHQVESLTTSPHRLPGRAQTPQVGPAHVSRRAATPTTSKTRKTTPGGAALTVSGSPSVGANSSVFFASGAPTNVAKRAGNVNSPTGLNEGLAIEILEKYGSRLLRSKSGVDIANFFREQCRLSNKTFLTFLFSKESLWDMCPEVHQLQKRLASANK